MITGNVKWFDVKKGFGFIVGPSGQDVFVHFSSIEGDGFRTLKDGEPVLYEFYEGEKGCFAKDVRRVRDGNAPAASQRDAEADPGEGPAAPVSEQTFGHMAASPNAGDSPE